MVFCDLPMGHVCMMKWNSSSKQEDSVIFAWLKWILHLYQLQASHSLICYIVQLLLPFQPWWIFCKIPARLSCPIKYTAEMHCAAPRTLKALTKIIIIYPLCMMNLNSVWQCDEMGKLPAISFAMMHEKISGNWYLFALK